LISESRLWIQVPSSTLHRMDRSAPMPLSPNEFIQTDLHRNSVSVLVGVNGAGKSRSLLKLADLLTQRGQRVLAVCNTPFDRFIGKRGVKRISLASGRSLPLHLLKQAIAKYDTLDASLNTICDTLAYCGYESRFMVSITPGPIAKYLNDNRIRYDEQNILGVTQVVEEYFQSIGRPPPKLTDKELEVLPYQLSRLRIGNTLTKGIFDAGQKSLGLSENRDLANLIRDEPLLRKVRAVEKISVTLYKNGEPIDLLDASSGELTLVSTFVFLSVGLPSESVLLIDEPENSLHPQWQREYMKRLQDVLAWRETTIVVSTHSPVIVLGARASSENVKVYQVHDGFLKSVQNSGDSKSIEETLWDAFETITPKNHFVSELLAHYIDELANNTMTLSEFKSYVGKLKQSSFDERQVQFLDAAIELAAEVGETNES